MLVLSYMQSICEVAGSRGGPSVIGGVRTGELRFELAFTDNRCSASPDSVPLIQSQEFSLYTR